MALEAKLRHSGEAEVETIWSDDGIVVRVPERERPPDAADLLPEPEEIEDLVVQQLGSTSLFAAHFREAAGRALLLPRRRPGQRTPLWIQRKKAHDLLKVATRHPAFPIVLETYRECLRDVFDLPGLMELARRVRAFSPEPGAFTFRDGRRLLIRRARPSGPGETGANDAPGTIGLAIRQQGVPVTCGGGTVLWLQRVQPAGRSEMDAEAAARGRHLPEAAVLR